MSLREAATLRAEAMAAHARGERTVESRTLTVKAVLAAVLLEYETNGRRSLDTAQGRARLRLMWRRAGCRSGAATKSAQPSGSREKSTDHHRCGRRSTRTSFPRSAAVAFR